MLKKTALSLAAAAVLGAGVAVPAHAAESMAGARPVRAPSPDLSSVGTLVDGIVTAQLAHDKIPGAAVVVVAGGEQVFAKGYGVADIGKRTPVDAGRTEFFTGSVAKLFTATAAAQLIQEGKLDPHADVNRYLTAFKIPDVYPGRPVTLENLLTHTAGFDDDPVGAAVADPSDVPALGLYLGAHQPPRVRPPGTLASYDNYGVALAGYLVEIASGEPFAQYVQEHIFGPLGMADTTFAQPHPAAVDAALARGYRPSGDSGQTPEKGQYGAWSPTGAGTVATAADLGRFMAAQLSGDPALGTGVTALVQRQHFTEDPRLPGMGYLFEERPRNGRRLLFKDGDIPGFHSDLALLPDQGVGIYVVYNGDGENGVAGWDGKALIDSVVDRYFPDTRTRPQPARDASASSYAGTYRVDRTSRSAVTRVATLVGAVTVDAGSDGTLTTSGLSQDPNASDQHWTPLGGGEFQERGGQDRLVFDGEGHMFTTIDPTVAYEKLAWYASPVLHQVLLGLGLLALVAGLIAFPAIALTRRLRGRPAHPAAARAARIVAWATAALATAFVVGFLTLASDGNAFNETIILGSGSLTAVLALNTLATVGTVGMVAGAAGAWTRRWWSLAGRVGYTAMALGAIAFVTVAFTYNLVGWPFA